MTEALIPLFARLIARPLWALALLVLVTLGAGWQAMQLRVAVDLSGLIGADSAGGQAMRAYSARFSPLRAEEVLLVRAPTLADDGALAALEELVLDMQFLPGVERVISLHGLPAPGRTGAWLTGPELAGLEPGARLAVMRSADPLAAQLLSADLSATLVVAVPQAGVDLGVFAQDLAALGAQFQRFEVDIVGIGAVQRAIGAELIHDLSVLTPAAVLICLVLSLVLFRRWAAVGVIALPPIVGLIWFLGWMGATGTGFDPVMGSLPVLLIVLAFSDSIHLHHAAAAAMREGGDRDAIIARASAQTAPAAVLTSVTTVIAFASLTLPESPSLNTMAVAGAAGMALCLAAVLVLTPVLMAVLGAPRLGARPPRLFAAVVPPARAVMRAARWMPLAVAGVLGVLLYAQSQSEVGFRYADYLPRGAEVSRALADMDRLGLGSDRMLVIVEADPGAPLARVSAAAEALYGEVGAVWAQGAGQGMLPRMAAGDGSAHALPITLPIAAADIRADQALAQVMARLEAAGLGPHVQVIGPGHALLTEGPRIVDSLRMGLYGTILAVTLLIGVIYRSWRLAAVSMVVNLIPILGVEAWLVAVGRELTIMNVIALTIAFGIAVDDTLHFLNRLRLASGTGPQRVEVALEEAGPPMTATTLILLAGLVVTLFSALPGLAVYGGLIALAVGLALLADLFILPALLRWSLR